MSELLRTLGETLPLVAVAVSLVGGFIALLSVNRGALRSRVDRGAAAGVALALGLAAGGVAAVYTAMLGSAWGDGNWLPVLPMAAVAFGAPVALTVAGAAALGYATLARLWPHRNAAAGAVLGPVILGAAGLAAIGSVGIANEMDAAAALAAEREQLAQNSAGLHLTVDRVTPTLDERGMVSTVRIELTLRSDTDLAMQLLPGKLVYPVFTLSPERNDPNTEIQTDAAPDGPSVLAAGVDTRYDLLFDPALTGTPTLSPPGEWLLTIGIGGADGVPYGLEAPVLISAS